MNHENPLSSPQRSSLWLEQFRQDLKLASRSLRKSPGFTTVVVLTLAFGIGANTAIFSLVNALVIKPLPYPNSERIVLVSENRNGGRGNLSGGGFIDAQEHTTKLEFVASTFDSNRSLTGSGDPALLPCHEVSADYLRVLGIQPMLGRGFIAEDDAPGGDARVAIITHELWQSRFGGDRTLLGRTISLNNEPVMVIGVLPPRALLNPKIMLIVPAQIRVIEWKSSREYHYFCHVIARLKADTTIEEASAELTIAKRRIKEQYPLFRRDWDIQMTTLHEATFGNTRPFVLILLTSVGFVLLIACANVANLLLARASSRQGEITLRVALGASTWRIIRQLFTETLLLAIAGGLGGLLLAYWLTQPLISFAGLEAVSSMTAVRIDLNVLLFVFAVTGVTAVLAGLIPAISVARPNLAFGLKDGARSSMGGSRRRMQSVLIVAETVLTVVLLVSAGLVLRSFMEALRRDSGFEPKNVVAFHFAQPETKSPTPEHRARFTDALFERLQQIPGVVSSGMASSVPMYGPFYYGDGVSRSDKPENQHRYWPGFDSVAGNYFQTMGIPLLRGRFMTPADNRLASPRVMIISASVAKALFGEENAIGRQLVFKKQPYEVVGIVGDVRRQSLEASPGPLIYLPQVFFPVLNPSIVVKTSKPSQSIGDDIRRAMRAVDSEQPISGLSTLEQSAIKSLSGRITMVTLLGFFAGAALILACIGLYGVMAYTVSQRTREMGVRIALGAERSQVVRLVLRDGIGLVVLGLLLGGAASYGTGRLLAKQFFQLAQQDPLVLACVTGVLLLVSLIACWLPALRAAKVDPVVALRSD